jgi:hypothetical protein
MGAALFILLVVVALLPAVMVALALLVPRQPHVRYRHTHVEHH